MAQKRKTVTRRFMLVVACLSGAALAVWQHVPPTKTLNLNPGQQITVSLGNYTLTATIDEEQRTRK